MNRVQDAANSGEAAADVVPSGGAAADAALSDQVVCGQNTQKT